MLQKSCSTRTGGEPNGGEFRRCTHTHKKCPRVGKGPENAVSQVERLHSEAAPGLGDRVCVIVGDNFGNGRQPPVFLAILNKKRLPYLKKTSAISKLKKVRITNVIVNFLSV